MSHAPCMKESCLAYWEGMTSPWQECRWVMRMCLCPCPMSHTRWAEVKVSYIWMSHVPHTEWEGLALDRTANEWDKCVTWVQTSASDANVWHEASLRVTRDINACGVRHTCVWRETYMRVTWGIHMCDTTSSWQEWRTSEMSSPSRAGRATRAARVIYVPIRKKDTLRSNGTITRVRDSERYGEREKEKDREREREGDEVEIHWQRAPEREIEVIWGVWSFKEAFNAATTLWFKLVTQEIPNSRNSLFVAMTRLPTLPVRVCGCGSGSGSGSGSVYVCVDFFTCSLFGPAAFRTTNLQMHMLWDFCAVNAHIFQTNRWNIGWKTKKKYWFVSDKAPTNKIYRRASSEQRLRTRSCHESERLV